MSGTPPEPRRSGRERKPAKPIATVIPTTTRKRKRAQSDAETDDERGNTEPETGLSGDEADEEENHQEEDDGEEYSAPKISNAGVKRKGRSKGNAQGGKSAPTAKRRRVQKTTENKTAKPRKGRKPKSGDASFDTDRVSKNSKISSDNPIFNAVINPSAALQSTAEDFLSSLQQDAGIALAELINFIMRCCGCNDSVNQDEVVDYDGVLDTLDNFTESLKQDESPTYPLASRQPTFKKFRNHLSEFLTRLITSAGEMRSLYDTDLMPVLQAWVIAMSSSQIRSFRHTATVIALELEAALCEVARGIEKEKELASRQVEGEKKRRSGKAAQSREKDVERRMKDIQTREATVKEYLDEFIDGVFVHRYRDTDPLIRTDCITALGKYFKLHPTHFLSATYLRYVGWLLSDQNTSTRLAAVKTLQVVYVLSSEAVEGGHSAPLNQFTERFRSRLLEMAEGDIDVGIRVGVLAVLQYIDQAGLLEEEDRDRLGSLIFSEELKVRKGVAAFVGGVWDEWVDEQMMEADGAVTTKSKGRAKRGKEKSDETRTKVGLKGVAMLLVKWGRVVDEAIQEEEDDGEVNEDDGSSNSLTKRSLQIAALANVSDPGASTKSRVSFAVEALLDELECLDDWQSLLDMLLLDHTAIDGTPSSSRRRTPVKSNGRRKNASESADGEQDDTISNQVEDIWRLEEEEESVLLEILTASFRRAREVPVKQKGDEEVMVNDFSRALIEALPRFFIKYQTDAARIIHVLDLPTVMNLEIYLEMRMTSNYSGLWDDVIKQFTSHASPVVLSTACNTIMHMKGVTALSNTNESKLLELEDELATSFRDVIADKESITVGALGEDDVNTLSTACLRLRLLTGMSNMSKWIDEDDSGKKTSLWEMLLALAERGRLGYIEEEMMIEQAQQILSIHILWKGLHFVNGSEQSEASSDAFLSQRDVLLEKFTEYAIGTQSNAVVGVRRVAFKSLVDLYIFFSMANQASETSPSGLALAMDEEVQFRCAGFVQAEMERYAEALRPRAEANGKSHPSDKGDSEDESAAGTPPPKIIEIGGRDGLTEEYGFLDVALTLLRAIKTNTIHVRHSSTLLSNYGRLGPAYDSCVKVIVDTLREAGLINGDVANMERVIVEAVQESFMLTMNGSMNDETHAVDLSKLLCQCFVLRGSQLSIIRRLESQNIVQIQTELLTWAGRKLSHLQKNSDKKSLRKAITFFKVLIPLLSRMQSRDALQIKAHLDQVLAQAKVDATPTSKLWEPLRVYEKRLAAIMAKDKAKSRKTKGKSAEGAGVTTDEDSELDRVADDTIPHDTDAGEESDAAEPKVPDNGDEPPDGPDGLVDDVQATPKASRKRPRSSGDEAGENDVEMDAPEGQEAPADERELTPVGDIIVRRKRLRR